MMRMRDMLVDSRHIVRVGKESKAREEEVIVSRISKIPIMQLLIITIKILDREIVEVDREVTNSTSSNNSR